jgi:hypothetical protein
MKSKRSLMTVLVGLAMLATPITAAAYDHNGYAHNNSRAAHVSRSSNAPVRGFVAPRNVVGPAVVARHELHNNALPAVRDWRADRAWRDANAYRNYGNRGYYPAPAYPAVAPYYGAPGYAGAQSCRQAQSIMYNYYRDRNTGHPAAAADLLARNQWAFRSGCGGAAANAGGLFRGLGGMPAYNNGGYGQPYGSTSGLAPLIQQFVR